MFRLLCILTAFCLLTLGCERQTETEPAPAPKPETAAPAPTQTQPGAGETTPQAPEMAAVPGFEEVQYPIDMEKGAQVYQEVCATCHREGIAGAPKLEDREAWQPRISQGMPLLVQHSIEGFQGNQGVMPPKGGAPSLSNEEVASAVAYMVSETLKSPPAQ